MRLVRRELLWHGVVAVIATQVVLAWNGVARPFLNVDEYVAGIGLKPYQFRVLPALVARVTGALLDGLGVTPLLEGRPPPFDRSATIAFMLLQVPCAVWLVREVRAWLERVSGDEDFGFWVAPGVLAVLPASLYAYTESNWYFPADLPAAAFMFALLRLAATRRWEWFYALFPIATLNRETTLLVTLSIALSGRRGRGLASHLVAQVALWATVKIALFYAFRDTPAEGPMQLFVVHPSLNVSYLVKPYWWPQVASAAAFLWVPALALWRRHEDRLLRGAMMTFPLYALVMLVVGHLVEVRVFTEYVPVFYTALSLVGWSAIRRRFARHSIP